MKHIAVTLQTQMMSRCDVCRALIVDILAAVLCCATRWRCVIHLCLGSGVYDENVCLLHLEREGRDGKSSLPKELKGSFMLLISEVLRFRLMINPNLNAAA